MRRRKPADARDVLAVVYGLLWLIPNNATTLPGVILSLARRLAGRDLTHVQLARGIAKARTVVERKGYDTSALFARIRDLRPYPPIEYVAFRDEDVDRV